MTVSCRYKLVSTGGTATALEKAGFAVTRVEELTSFPEMVSNFDAFLLSQPIEISSLFSIWTSSCHEVYDRESLGFESNRVLPVKAKVLWQSVAICHFCFRGSSFGTGVDLDG